MALRVVTESVGKYPAHTPKLSVIVSTYNRKETLARAIRHLAEQDYPAQHYEVIISDDGSTDGTREMVASLDSRVPFTLKYHRHPNGGPGVTHNCGIREASGHIVLLVADDMLLRPHALSAHMRAHAEHPELHVAILGNVRQAPELNTSVFQRHWEPHRSIRTLRDRAELPFTLFWAINLSAKREFLIRNGLFSETNGPGGAAAHEDVELGCRLAKHGLRILHYKDADGVHWHPETLQSVSRRAYERGLNWPEFAAKAPVRDLAVRYHVLDWSTLAEHLRAVFRADRGPLLESDYGGAMFFKNLARPILFSELLVSRLWRPLLERAEERERLEPLVHPCLYRGVAQFYFRKGIRDYRRWSRNRGALEI